jgi:hypothetical protein
MGHLQPLLGHGQPTLIVEFGAAPLCSPAAVFRTIRIFFSVGHAEHSCDSSRPPLWQFFLEPLVPNNIYIAKCGRPLEYIAKCGRPLEKGCRRKLTSWLAALPKANRDVWGKSRNQARLERAPATRAGLNDNQAQREKVRRGRRPDTCREVIADTSSGRGRRALRAMPYCLDVDSPPLGVGEQPELAAL